MNKRLVSCFLAALLLLSLLPAAAFAEGNIVVNLGSVRAGSPLELQIATTDAGTASLADGSLPDGCSISTEERGGSFAHYLSGTPKNAGSYEFTLKVTDTVVIISNVTANSDAEDEEPEETAEPEVTPEPTPEPTPEVTPEPEERIEESTVATLKCSLTVLPDVPELTVKDVSCFVGEEARIELQATVNDGGNFSTIKELGTSKKIVFVPVDGEALKKLTAKYPFYVEWKIPKETYGTDDDTVTAAVE